MSFVLYWFMTTNEDRVAYQGFVMHHRHIATNSWLSVGGFSDFHGLRFYRFELQLWFTVDRAILGSV